MILGVPNLYLASLVPPLGILEDNLGTSGDPWEAIGAAERPPWGPESDFYGGRGVSSPRTFVREGISDEFDEATTFFAGDSNIWDWS